MSELTLAEEFVIYLNHRDGGISMDTGKYPKLAELIVDGIHILHGGVRRSAWIVDFKDEVNE